MKELYNLGIVSYKHNDLLYSFINAYISFLNWIFGFQYQSNSFDVSIIDMYGKELLNQEVILFDSQLLSSLVADFNTWNLTFKDVLFLVHNRSVSSMLYHFTSTGFFFTDRVSVFNFFERKNANLMSSSSLGVFPLLSGSTITPSLFESVKSSYVYDDESILRDTFFESQDFKHSTSFEFIWALFPTSIILSILVPSLYLLYSLDEDLDPKLTIKVIGHQWYWSYEFDNWVEISPNLYEFVYFKFDSNIIPTDSLEVGTKRVLEVDKRLVVPTNVTLRFLVTSVTCYIHERCLL